MQNTTEDAPNKAKECAAIIYYRMNGALRHWTISCHPEFDDPVSLAAHLEKWLPSAEFVEARIEKMTLFSKDERDYFGQLRASLDFLRHKATRVVTVEGHLIVAYVVDGERWWYAYPNLNPFLAGDGGEVLRVGDTYSSPKKFSSVLEAYQACLEAVRCLNESKKV
jgi:hypothetical protein